MLYLNSLLDRSLRQSRDCKGASGNPRESSRQKLVPYLLESTMMFAIVFWIGLSGTIFAQSPGNQPAGNALTSDSGVFSILAAQHQVGTEKFKITPIASGLEATGEIQLDMPGVPKSTETCFLRLDSNLRPTSYERQQKSPKKGTLIAQFGSPESKLSAKTETGSDERIFYLPDKHLVVLDTNFFHHYAILIHQYDSIQSGVQQFNVFVPQEATPGTISLELKGKENQSTGKTTQELNHFEAVTDQVKIGIWATPAGEIYRISIPQANLEVVRQ